MASVSLLSLIQKMTSSFFAASHINSFKDCPFAYSIGYFHKYPMGTFSAFITTSVQDSDLEYNMWEEDEKDKTFACYFLRISIIQISMPELLKTSNMAF